jgi:hypothetical protein
MLLFQLKGRKLFEGAPYQKGVIADAGLFSYRVQGPSEPNPLRMWASVIADVALPPLARRKLFSRGAPVGQCRRVSSSDVDLQLSVSNLQNPTRSGRANG